MSKRNSTSLKHRMAGRWLSALGHLAPSLREAIDHLGDSVRCPREGWPDAFRLFKDANETGGGVRHSYRIFAEGIDLLMWVNDWSFPQAFDELEAWLGGKPVEVGPAYIPKPKAVVDETWLRGWLNKIWQESLPVDHLMAYPARAYFRNRRMSEAATAASDIRFHRCLSYKDKQGNLLGKFGAILALVRNNQGEPVQIHRTFITKGGLKVTLPNPNKAKKMTPPVNKDSKGRQIRLFPPMNGYLGISEGLETALAVQQARQFPVWPGLSNTILHSFLAPEGVHTVINFVDKDRSKAGEESALVIRKNLEAQGKRVIDLIPPTPILDEDAKGVDWADQLMRDPAGFQLLDDVLRFDQRIRA